MDIKKELKAFKKEFGIDDADTFPAFSGGIEGSAVLKCNWLGWKKRAELECKENPETIEIDGLKTIHKLCKFGADHNMDGCSFTEIIERMFRELKKAQAVPEGFVLVPKSDLESWHLWDGDSDNMYRDHYSESICDDVELGAVFEIDAKMAFKVAPIYVVPIYSDSDDYEYEEFESEELAKKAAADNKAMIEAQEQSHDSESFK